jgi:hypothetical protein
MSAEAVLNIAVVAIRPAEAKDAAIAVDSCFFMLHSSVFKVSIKSGLLESCGD